MALASRVGAGVEKADAGRRSARAVDGPEAAPGQRRSEAVAVVQRRGAEGLPPLPGPRGERAAANRTGLPEALKAGVERLSGLSLDDVRVHHDSPEPARMGALAFTRGTEIHVAPGQARHLAHETWHVVQQKQGRVRATTQLMGERLNDDAGLEREADVMGARAARGAGGGRAHRGRAGTGGEPVVQRVESKKIGFKFEDASRKKGDQKLQVEQGQAELMRVWQGVRTRRRTKRAEIHTTRVPELARRARNEERIEGGFSKAYADLLVVDYDQLEALKLALKTNSKFELAGSVIKYKYNNKPPAHKIAVWMTGENAYEESAATGGPPRKIYRKRGLEGAAGSSDPKEYVQDSRGVFTRRYAYVEKNYYQMMEFFMSNHMEGRFQQFMRAAGEATPDIHEHSDEKVALVWSSHTGPKITEDMRMAVAHQKLGSGPQQRGVSLTSTPKIGVTYVNTGENFRTAHGFRLKVDLAKIPRGKHPLLINHYAQGGVSDTVEETPRALGEASMYPYRASAVHARELYLEYLKPEWVVEVEYHAQDGVTKGQVTATVDAARTTFGGDAFKAGFDEGLAECFASKAKITPAESVDLVDGGKNHKEEGKNCARHFVKGCKIGRSKVVQDAPLSSPQQIFDAGVAYSTKVDFARLGFIWGRAGKPDITSYDQLPVPGAGP